MSVCRVCGEQGHLASKCKDLHAPDSETLYQGEGCSGGHDGEDDEKVAAKIETHSSLRRNSIKKRTYEDAAVYSYLHILCSFICKTDMANGAFTNRESKRPRLSKDVP
jgi:hypothetical protein